MDRASYDFMKVGEVYDSYYLIGGSCLITKAVDTANKGQVIAQFADGRVKKTHYRMVSLIMMPERRT